MGIWDWRSYLLYMSCYLISGMLLSYYDCYHKDNCKSNILLVLSLLPTFLLFALRNYTVGRDLVGYNVHVISYYSQESIISHSLIFTVEPLFELVYYISGLFGGLHAFIIITSFLFYMFLFILLRNFHFEKQNTSLFFLLFFSMIGVRSFSMVSNGIATVCSFCAYFYLSHNEKGAKFKYWWFTIIAIGFHLASLINILIYFFCKSYTNKNERITGKIVSTITFVVLFIICCWLYVSGKLDAILYSFFGGGYSRFANIKIQSGIGNTIVRLPLIFMVIICYKELHKYYGSSINTYLALLVFDLLISQLKYFHQDFERFTMFTSYSTIYLLACLFRCYKNKLYGYLKIIIIIPIILILTYYLYLWGIIGDYGLMPYRTW